MKGQNTKTIKENYELKDIPQAPLITQQDIHELTGHEPLPEPTLLTKKDIEELTK